MSYVVYFSKVNVVSEDIYDIYRDNQRLQDFRECISASMQDGRNYVEEYSYEKDGEPFTEVIRYRLKILTNNGLVARGRISKKSLLYYNRESEENGEIHKDAVENIEVIDFYFDIHKELVGFYTKRRFRHKKFNEALSGLINTWMVENEFSFRVDLSLYTQGLGINEIQNRLANMGPIQELKFKFQPPNPDEQLLDEIRRNGETLIENMQAGNVTTMYYVYDCEGDRGLNVQSTMINNSINQLSGLHSYLSTEEAVARGYVSLEALTVNGDFFSTEDENPVKIIIENLDEFDEACHQKIISLIA